MIRSSTAQKLGTLVIVLFLGVIVLSGGLLIWKNKPGNSETIKLIAPRAMINIETATTDEQRKIGLSGRTKLDDKSGMMFYFEQSSKNNCFWMKDTLIPLDMVFLDSDKKVVTVHKNVTPDTYPKSFCPTSNAKYGLEINANKSDEFGLEKGAVVQFD